MKPIVKQTAYGDELLGRLVKFAREWPALLTVGELAKELEMKPTHNFRRHVADMVQRQILVLYFQRDIDSRWRQRYAPSGALLNWSDESKEIPF